MFTNVAVSAVFLILAIVVFIVLCFKGMHTGIAALIAAFIAAFGSADSLATSIFSTFPSGVGSLVTMMFFVFTASGLFALMMEKTGCAMSVGNTMVKWLGVDRSWIAISVTTILLLLAGVGTYTYVVVVLSMPLMKAANLPRKVGMIAGLGIAVDISFCFPAANVPGSLPNSILGTTIFSAPLLSCATGVLGIIMFVLWMIHMVKKARKEGKGYDGPEDVEELDDSDLPSFVSSVIPLVVVVVAAMIFAAISINGNDFEALTGIDSTNQVALAQLCGCISVALIHFKRCRKAGFIALIRDGCPSMWPFLVLAGCVYGFGQVATSVACIEPIQNAVLNLNASPYISAMLSVAVIAALTTDGISAMMVWLPMFGQTYLDMGVDPGALRRLLLCTSQTFDSLPHAQSTAITLSLYGLNHKEGYWDIFVTTVIFPVIFSIFCCICCIIFF